MKLFFHTLMILGILAYGASSYAHPVQFECTTNNCPAGSYKGSCTDCSMDGSTLNCEQCYKSGDIEASASRLPDARACGKDIQNCEGTLVCGSVCCRDCGTTTCCEGKCCDKEATCKDGSCCLECGEGCCGTGSVCKNNQCCNSQGCVGVN